MLLKYVLSASREDEIQGRYFTTVYNAEFRGTAEFKKIII